MNEGDDGLMRLMGRLAIDLQSQSDPEATLRSIVSGAVRLVPGTTWAGISLIKGRHIESRVPTDPIAAKLDALQMTLNDGPCVSALREHHTVLIDDMATETRWPRFAATARDLGVESVLSFQLFVQAENLGALNLYASEAHVYEDDATTVGTVIAQHASVAMAASAAEAQWRHAIDTRDVIGQAKGLLMQRNGVSGLHAFEMLVQASQESQMKLVDIARWLVESHESTAVAAPASQPASPERIPGPGARSASSRS